MKTVVLYDTTLRDGAQAEGVSFSLDDKIRIAQKLDRLGIDYIEGGWPGSNPKDMEFLQRWRDYGLQHATVCAFGSTRRAGMSAAEDANLQAIVESGVTVATVFGKSWDFHVSNVLRTTLDENLAMIEDSVRFLRSRGMRVFFDGEHFFDGYRANPDYAIRTLQAAASAGAEVLVLCDTNGGFLPQYVSPIVAEAVKRFAGVDIGVHMHNDAGTGVANTLVGVDSGAKHVQGTMNGYGERAGNADLCTIIANLKLKMGVDCVTAGQLSQLTKTAHYIDEIANRRPNPHQPYVGRSVFTHKAGVHVNALLKHPTTYEHIDASLVGNRRRVVVSELSGGSNIRYKARELDINLDGDPDRIASILNSVKNLEYEGYSFEGAEASFELMLRRTLGLHEDLFELEGFRLIIEKKGANGPPVSEATVKVRIGGETIHTAAEGDGPVNALDNALRKALTQVYPEIQSITLTDYKVRVIDEEAGTAAKVRVLIESTSGGYPWGTVGVSTNIIEASWRALADSIEYGLLRQPGAFGRPDPAD
jgi:2-isopropylmalate synthase